MTMTRPARTRALPVLASALCMALGAPAAFAQSPEPYRLLIQPDTLRADAQGIWRFTLRLENHGELGLYPDSLSVHWEGDAGGRPTRGDNDLSALAHSIQAIGAGEANESSVNMPATQEQGRLDVRFEFHDPQHQSWVERRTLIVAGSALAERFTTAHVTASGRDMELLILPADSSSGPAPGVLFVPATGVAALSLERWALPLHDRGYAVGLLSPPGAGGSQGPDDAAGPVSVEAARAALARLAATDGVDAKRLVLWGEEQGGTTALLAAVGRTDLLGVVAVDARFDPWAHYRGLQGSAREAFVRAAGRDSAGWRARSPLRVAAKITAPVLLLQTREGGDPATAEAFVSARAGHVLDTEARGQAGEIRPPRRADTVRLVLDYLARKLR
jgi:hypothetical protein